MPYYSDIDINLKKATSGDIVEQINADAIKNSINNILSTLQGSRRMLPQFAINVQQLLFEPMDEMTSYELGDRILEAIQIWDSRIIIENVTVKPKYDDNIYQIRLSFSIQGIREQEEVEFILRKV